MSATRTFVPIVSRIVEASVVVLLTAYTASTANFVVLVLTRFAAIATARSLTLIMNFFVVSHGAVTKEIFGESKVQHVQKMAAANVQYVYRRVL